MIILKRGQLKEPKRAWWVGQKGKCWRCGCEVELQVGDDLLLPDHPLVTFIKVFPDAPESAHTICPTPECGNVITFYPQ